MIRRSAAQTPAQSALDKPGVTEAAHTGMYRINSIELGMSRQVLWAIGPLLCATDVEDQVKLPVLRLDMVVDMIPGDLLLSIGRTGSCKS